MHARAHGIPTTPLTSDTTTALLSTILTSKPTSGETVKIKQEPVESSSGCSSTKSCSQENQEPMDDYSLPSSCNPSPRSASMDDDMTDWAAITCSITRHASQDCLGLNFERGSDLLWVLFLLVWVHRVIGCFGSWVVNSAVDHWWRFERQARLSDTKTSLVFALKALSSSKYCPCMDMGIGICVPLRVDHNTTVYKKTLTGLCEKRTWYMYMAG